MMRDDEKKMGKEFVKNFPTYLHNPPKSVNHLWVFWSQEILQQQQQGFQTNNNSYSPSSADADIRRRGISDKIKDALAMVISQHLPFLAIVQFWAPVTTISGRRLLSTSGQPFAVTYPDKRLSKYRLRCEEYQYDIIHPNHNDDENNNKHSIIQDSRDFNPPFIISDHDAPTPTCLVATFQNLEGANPSPLVDSALECGLTLSFMLPIWFPFQTTSCFIGVLHFSTHSKLCNTNIFSIIGSLKKVGLGAFQGQKSIPYQIISGLKPAKDEIENALKIVCKSNGIALAQVWISFEDDNHVSFSSYVEGILPKKQMLSLKLTGYLAATGYPRWHNDHYGEYYGLCDMFPLEMGKDFVKKTLQDYKPRFCDDVSKLSDGTLVGKHISLAVDGGLAICLNSIHTGAFCYAFEFIWKRHPYFDDVKFVEELLLKLKELLPSFKLASGAELGNEIDVINVGNSTATETKFMKIFQGKRLSPIPEVLEEGRSIPVPMVVDRIPPLEARCKTTPIPSSREVIEQQFGHAETEAAENLKVSQSTSRRKCRKFGILKSKGPNKRKVNDLDINQSDTNKEDTGTIQEPLAVNRNEHTLTIKAEYAGDMIKFRLHISRATFKTVMEEIRTRLKLTPGTYKVKYLDEDKDWILLTSEQGISDCIETSRNSDRTAVRLHVEPST